MKVAVTGLALEILICKTDKQFLRDNSDLSDLTADCSSSHGRRRLPSRYHPSQYNSCRTTQINVSEIYTLYSCIHIMLMDFLQL